MKQIGLFTIFMLFTANFIYSQILFEENFDYAAGDSIQMHGWTVHSGSTGPWTVISPGLSFANYPLSGIGNAAKTDSAGFQDANKNFTEQTSGSVYTAMMVNVISATTTGDYFAHIGNTSLGSTFRGKMFVKDNGAGGFVFGISMSANTADATYETTARSYNTTYLIVMKYKFDDVAGDSASMYVFDSNVPSTEPAAPTIGPDGSGSGLDNAGTIALRQGSASFRPQLIVDGMRIATSWQDMITSIEPISYVADKFELSQNYPNPFNPSTKIRFSTPTSGFVTMKVFNVLGQQIATLVNNRVDIGVHEVEFVANNIPSGVYLYTVEFTGTDHSSFKDAKKFILSK